MSNQSPMLKHYPIRVDDKLHKEMMNVKTEHHIVWSEIIREFIQSKIEELKNKNK